MKYLIIIEKGETSYGAYSPDIPGCIAVGESVEDAEARMLNAIEQYLEFLREEGKPAPVPTTASASFMHIAPPGQSSEHAA